MYLEPHVRSTQISQRLCGHEVDVLDEEDDWYRVRGSDDYEGWIHWGFLSPEIATNGRRRARVSLGCVIENARVGRRPLPLGARLSPDDVVRSGEAIDEEELVARFPPDPLAITRSAREMFESAPYLWGGVTPWGADCSGFAQTVFGLHGVALPRDAWQQSESGTEAGGGAGALDRLRPADLLFFSDRKDQRVTHVAIALGEQRIVHLALGRGGFAVENLADPKDPYVAKLRERFLRARRIL